MTSERNLQWVDEVIAELEDLLARFKARRDDQEANGNAPD